MKPNKTRWMMLTVKRLGPIALFFVTLSLISPWLLRTWLEWRFKSYIFTSQAAPAGPVAVVLGAGLWRDGSPTPVLYDRVATAVELYQTGKVKKLLLSGDNSVEFYNEPAAMRRVALQLGVPEEDIVLDYAGRRTYDTCYRAKAVFEIEQAVVVTQQFHLNRALYLCHSLGIESVGVIANRRQYRRSWHSFWQIRETAAVVKAVLDINILRPQPILGEKLPIEIATQ